MFDIRVYIYIILFFNIGTLMENNFNWAILFGLNILLLFGFFNFCLQTGIFERFGRRERALSGYEFFLLTLASVIPMIGFFTTFYIMEKYLTQEIVQSVIFAVIILNLGFHWYKSLIISFKKLQTIEI